MRDDVILMSSVRLSEIRPGECNAQPVREYRMPRQGFVFGHPAPRLSGSCIVRLEQVRRTILSEGREHFIPQLAKIAPGR